MWKRNGVVSWLGSPFFSVLILLFPNVGVIQNEPSIILFHDTVCTGGCCRWEVAFPPSTSWYPPHRYGRWMRRLGKWLEVRCAARAGQADLTSDQLIPRWERLALSTGNSLAFFISKRGFWIKVRSVFGGGIWVTFSLFRSLLLSLVRLGCLRGRWVREVRMGGVDPRWWWAFFVCFFFSRGFQYPFTWGFRFVC